MEKRRFRVHLSSESTVEIELQMDRFELVGENSVEFISGGQKVLCLNFRSKIERMEEIAASASGSRPDMYLERRIDLDL